MNLLDFITYSGKFEFRIFLAISFYALICNRKDKGFYALVYMYILAAILEFLVVAIKVLMG